MSNYPAIPTPTPDIEGLFDTVKTLKQVVDLLTGVVGNAGPSMRIYVQATAPTSPTAGDAWLRTSDRNFLIYNAAGETWVASL